jgi:TctA family transporter
MSIARGDATVLVTRPISLTLLLLSVAALVIAVLPAIRKKRDVVFQEEPV